MERKWKIVLGIFISIIVVFGGFIASGLSSLSFLLSVILIFAILSIVISILNRAFETGHIIDYAGVVFVALLLLIFLFALSSYLGVSTLIHWASIITFIPLIIFWIFTIEMERRWLT